MLEGYVEKRDYKSGSDGEMFVSYPCVFILGTHTYESVESDGSKSSVCQSTEYLVKEQESGSIYITSRVFLINEEQ